MDFEGKTILVTGAAQALAEQSPFNRLNIERGSLLGRTVEKLEAVFDDIEKAGCPTPSILPVDLEGAT